MALPSRYREKYRRSLSDQEKTFLFALKVVLPAGAGFFTTLGVDLYRLFH